MPKKIALSAPDRIFTLPLSDWGDSFRPNSCPALPDDPIVAIAEFSECIGHYNGHPAPLEVFRRHIGQLDGRTDLISGDWDVIVCPDMALRVMIPRTIQTWGELWLYLTDLVGTATHPTGYTPPKRPKLPKK